MTTAANNDGCSFFLSENRFHSWTDSLKSFGFRCQLQPLERQTMLLIFYPQFNGFIPIVKRLGIRLFQSIQFHIVGMRND